MLLAGEAADASCVPMTPAEQRARASVIFDGVALEGAAATGIQRFRVLRYLKGRGPKVVGAATGSIRRGDGSGSATSVSIIVERAQSRRINARGSAWRVVQTNVCDGSRRLRR